MSPDGDCKAQQCHALSPLHDAYRQQVRITLGERETAHLVEPPPRVKESSLCAAWAHGRGFWRAVLHSLRSGRRVHGRRQRFLGRMGTRAWEGVAPMCGLCSCARPRNNGGGTKGCWLTPGRRWSFLPLAARDSRRRRSRGRGLDGWPSSQGLTLRCQPYGWPLPSAVSLG